MSSSAFTTSAQIPGLPLDERGLVPLEKARAIVRAATEFSKDEGRMVDGTHVRACQELWAALMSLSDAEEFVREASRLEWTYHPGKAHWRDPARRYGEGILPWLRSFVHDEDILVNVPWAVLECLKEIGTPEALELLLGLDDILHYEGEPGQPGPFAHGFPFRFDRQAALESFERSDEISDALAAAVKEFAIENPGHSWARLLEVAESKTENNSDVLALHVLRLAGLERGSEIFAHAVAALGNESAVRARFAQLGVPTGVESRLVLWLLDRACGDAESWPYFYGLNHERAYHALRLVAARKKGADDWFVLFECLEGSMLDGGVGRSLYIRRYMVKADGAAGLLRGVGFPHLEIESEGPLGVVFAGPLGSVTVDAAKAERYLPQQATAQDVEDMKETLGVRAYLAECGLPFPSLPDFFESIGLGDEADSWDVLVDSTAFEHVVGTAGIEYDPDGIDARWRLLPSQSPVYRSLAEAIVHRDAGRFAPGTSNLDWRLHVDAPNPSRTGITVGAPSQATLQASAAAMAAVAAGGDDDDPVVFPGKPLAKLSDYVAFMKRLQTGDMMGALAAHGLDMMGYGAVAQEWAAKLGSDPTLMARMTTRMTRG
jgi:hypothetical protein